MLAPAHLEVLRMEENHRIMQEQATHLAAQAERYNAFEQAVERREPLAMELLAERNLNLRPAGRLTLAPAGGVSGSGFAGVAGGPSRVASRGGASGGVEVEWVSLDARPVDADWPPDDMVFCPPKPDLDASPAASASMDNWLYKPLPESHFDPDDLPEAKTRLARFTAGGNRVILAAAAGVLLFAGLLPR